MPPIHDDLYIDGRWRPAHGVGQLEVVNPTTEEVWAHVPSGDSHDIDSAVAAARRAQHGWASTPPSARATLIRKFADEIEAIGKELTRVITTENGTPISETASAPSHAAAHLRLVADLEHELTRDDIRPNPMSPGSSLVQRRPLGVAGLITPWNFPLGLMIIKLGPALLAGCTTVLKPAPQTPMAARLLMDAVTAAGFPPGVINLVTGGNDAGVALVEHPDVDKISFTGSTLAGRSIGAACGERLRPVTLELGGKSAAIVLEDADLDMLAANILRVAMRNTGQTCKACTRLLVPANQYDRVVDLVSDVVSSAPMGDPFDPTTFFGPLVSATQRTRVLDYLDIGRSEGAKAVVGGGAATEFSRGYFVQPTVFRDVTPGMRIAREEIFGPVLSVLPYTDIDDAVAQTNDSPYGLAGAIFSRDIDRAVAVASRIDSGNIGINHYGSNAAAPFSGHKDSGLGTEFGPEGLAQYMSYTSVHLQTR